MKNLYKDEYNFLTKELHHSFVNFYKIFYKYGRRYTVFIETNYGDYYIMGVVSTYKTIVRDEENELYEIGEDWAHIETGFDLDNKNYDVNANTLIDLLYNQYQKNENEIRYK